MTENYKEQLEQLQKDCAQLKIDNAALLKRNDKLFDEKTLLEVDRNTAQLELKTIKKQLEIEAKYNLEARQKKNLFQLSKYIVLGLFVFLAMLVVTYWFTDSNDQILLMIKDMSLVIVGVFGGVIARFAGDDSVKTQEHEHK